jgi:hypothetical protein
MARTGPLAGEPRERRRDEPVARRVGSWLVWWVLMMSFVTPAALVAPALVALAIFVQMGLYENTGETVLVLLFMVIAGPYLSHATIRAIRVREKGDWRLHQGAGASGEKEEP